MNIKKKGSLLKHIDFICIDIILLQISYALANLWYKSTFSKQISMSVYRTQSLIFLLCQVLIILSTNPYKNILKRDKYAEIKSLTFQLLMTMIFSIFVLYLLKVTGRTSRLTTIATWMIFFAIDLIFRYIWKRILRQYYIHSPNSMRAAVVITDRHYAKVIVDNLYANPLSSLRLTGLFIPDYDKKTDADLEYRNVKVLGGIAELHDYVIHQWCDEVFIYLPGQQELRNDLIDGMERIGIPVHRVMAKLTARENGGPAPTIQKYGNYAVATYKAREVQGIQLFLKRVLDILGGIVGCIITFFLIIFIGPAIYIKSPGPIFFAQKRVGHNGKVFRMYKFRSMYMDAEERKAELMKQNKIKDGMMFKMDDDPRIIGSEKKDKNGKPKGIGNFIRNTSLDEFPQFFNVLKGDMSLVGTRPPTLDEWSKYTESHRKRLSIRPGITGLWQISGRSSITDFDEVVRLDSQYIDTWTILKDIKIILMTISKVLKRDGAE